MESFLHLASHGRSFRFYKRLEQPCGPRHTLDASLIPRGFPLYDFHYPQTMSTSKVQASLCLPRNSGGTVRHPTHLIVEPHRTGRGPGKARRYGPDRSERRGWFRAASRRLSWVAPELDALFIHVLPHLPETPSPTWLMESSVKQPRYIPPPPPPPQVVAM